MDNHYILNKHEPVLVKNPLVWDAWFRTANRQIDKDKMGDIEITTIFLGVDDSAESSPPLLFKTEVFGGELNGKTNLWSTWNQAEAGHRAMLMQVDQSINSQ